MTESSTILNIHTDFTGETKLKGSFYAFLHVQLPLGCNSLYQCQVCEWITDK